MISVTAARKLTPSQAEAEMGRIQRLGRVTQATENGAWDALYERAYHTCDDCGRPWSEHCTDHTIPCHPLTEEDTSLPPARRSPP